VLRGGKGDDRLAGGDLADYLRGGPGDDLAHGGGGKDFYLHGKGVDTVFLGRGADQIQVGAPDGVDIFHCGPDFDQIVYRGRADPDDELDGCENTIEFWHGD
jgi:serralysin